MTRARGPFDEVGEEALVGGLLVDGPLATTTLRMNAPGRDAGLPMHDDVPLLERHDSSADGSPCALDPES